jgi:hypothetical protein
VRIPENPGVKHVFFCPQAVVQIRIYFLLCYNKEMDTQEIKEAVQEAVQEAGTGRGAEPEVKQIEPFKPSVSRPIKEGMNLQTEFIDELEEDPALEDLVTSTQRKLVVEKTSFHGSTVSTQPLRNSNHAVVLLNLTHRHQRPRHKYPGFRILGAFPNEKSLKLHVSKHCEGSEASLFMTPVHQLLPICQSDALQADREHNKTQIDALVEIYNSAADARDADFKSNVAKSVTGAVGDSMYQSKLKCIEAIEKAPYIEDAEEGLPHHLAASAQIVDQRFAAIIVLSDIRDAVKEGRALPEPCLAILGVFATEEEAVQYAKFTASKAFPKCDVDVVDTCVWHFPENIHPDKVKDVYGSSRLDQVMTARKENAGISADFESWCRDNGIEPDITEIQEQLRA